MTQYVVIENTPGYMPDDEDPPVFEEYADAVAYLNERCKEYEGEGCTVEYGWASSANLAAAAIGDPSKMYDLGRWIAVELDEF